MNYRSYEIKRREKKTKEKKKANFLIKIKLCKKKD
jgi:hypothetical protein